MYVWCASAVQGAIECIYGRVVAVDYVKLVSVCEE